MTPADTIREALERTGQRIDQESRDLAAASLAALTELEADRDRLQASLKTCPYCACTYELPTGWLHDSCPGCLRADRYREALEQIADGRCSCGGRFKSTGVQTRCEKCDTHQGYGNPSYTTDAARAALDRQEQT